MPLLGNIFNLYCCSRLLGVIFRDKNLLKNKSYEVREEILPEQFFERFRTTVRKPRKRSCDDSDPNHDEDDEILGSDDDEQESPKDYCKVHFYWLIKDS